MAVKRFSSISKNNNIKRIAIGKFESMHLAHMAIFRELGENDIILIIKMPRSNLGEILPYKMRHIYAPREMYFVDFRIISSLSGKEFIAYLKDILPCLESIVVGADFRFGKDRKYGVDDIKALSLVNVIALQEITLRGIPLHSSYIKDFIVNGNIALANEFLGRLYSICGTRIQGQGLGKAHCVPTINIAQKHFVVPKHGVYATYTRIGLDIYRSVSFIGTRGTDRNFSIETHIIDKLRNEGEKIEIFFVEFIRENRAFTSLKELKLQIMRDIRTAQHMLENVALANQMLKIAGKI